MVLTRAVQACQRCRSRKSRCLPGSRESSCRACERQGHPCVPHVPAKRGSLARQTIKELSAQVEALHDHVATSQNSGRIDTTLHDLNNASVSQDGSTTADWCLATAIIDKLQSASITSGQCPLTWFLDLTQIQASLVSYNEMAQLLPFAILADDENAISYIRSCPVSTLAALAVVPQIDSAITFSHATVFRRVLADQALVRGKQSIDLLVGLCTYLLWSHHCYDPETQQFYQQLQLAKGMADDLCLFDKLDTLRDISSIEDVVFARVVATLAYLDQSGGVIGYGKRQRLVASAHADSAGRIIADFGEREADRHALHILQMTRNCASLTGHTAKTGVDAAYVTQLRDLPSATVCAAYTVCVAFDRAWRAFVNFARTFQNGPCPESLKQGILQAFSEVIDTYCNHDVSYLGTMGLIEWAQLLATLVTIPQLELVGAESLQGRSLDIFRRLRRFIGEAFTRVETLSHATHMWWLHVIIQDCEDTVNDRRAVDRLEDSITTPLYILLEELTERQTGMAKKVEAELKNPTEKTVLEYTKNSTWPEFMQQWVTLD